MIIIFSLILFGFFFYLQSENILVKDEKPDLKNTINKMKASLQFKITQGLRMTPQLQQAIHLLQLSNIELNAIIQEQLDSNMMLEIEEADSNEDLSSTEIEKIDANGSDYDEFELNEESGKSDIEYSEADYVWNEVNSAKTAQKKNNLERVLIIADNTSKLNIEKSSRNIPNLKLVSEEGVNLYDILKYKNLLITETSIKYLEKKLI